METLLFLCLTLVSCLLAVLIVVVVGSVGLGAWWYWNERQSTIQRLKALEPLVGTTWQMGGKAAEALEKDLRDKDLQATYGRSRKTYAP